MQIIEKIRSRMMEVDSMAGVGIDPVYDRIPESVKQEAGGRSKSAVIELFCRRVIDATHEFVVDYKINSSFFMDSEARSALEGTFAYLREKHPEIVAVCDGKFGDVEHTAGQIAHYVYDVLGADAVLLNPYLGYDAIQPFVERADKAVVLCVNTSNPSADQIQDLILQNGEPLWRHILKQAMSEWNQNGNIIPVVSATHTNNLVGLREIIGETPVVLAGVGMQGGDLHTALQHVRDSQGYGAMISSSRGIIYPDTNGDYWLAVSKKAQALRDSIRGVEK